MKTITFYSYKGGVGRTLAMATIATRLSEFNKRVVMIDFDLEAPGLPMKFSKFVNGNRIRKGIVDYIYEFTNKGHLPESIIDYAITFQTTLSRTPISMIPAGNILAREYWQKLSSINWFDLLYQDKNGLSFFLDMKEKIKKEFNPDLLLIDSRTGISEMSAITLSLLAEEVVVVAANNMENLTGAKKIIENLSNPGGTILNRRPKITFVLSRIPLTDNPEDKAREKLLRDKVIFEMKGMVSDITIIHSDRELELNEQIKMAYQKDDTTPQISRDYLNLFERLTKDILTDNEVEKFNQIKESEKIFHYTMGLPSEQQRIEGISRAIELNPNNKNFYLTRGIEYEKMRNYDLALKDYEHIFAIDQHDFLALMMLGGIYRKMHEFEKSISNFKQYMELYPRDFNVYNQLGITYSDMKKYPDALDNFQKAIDLNPFDASPHNNMANTYRLMGIPDKALVSIYKSLEINPDLFIAYSTLAEIMADIGNLNQFYLNMEVFIRNLVVPDRSQVETVLRDEIYKRFANDERFKALLEKYSIVVPSL